MPASGAHSTQLAEVCHFVLAASGDSWRFAILFAILSGDRSKRSIDSGGARLTTVCLTVKIIHCLLLSFRRVACGYCSSC